MQTLYNMLFKIVLSDTEKRILVIVFLLFLLFIFILGLFINLHKKLMVKRGLEIDKHINGYYKFGFVKTEKDLGFVGEVTQVNPEILATLLDQDFIPVVSTVASGEQGDSANYNINADTAAAKIAVALKAEKFVQLTNVPGVLRDVNDPSTLIKRIERTAIGSLKATGIISSGMIPKIDCCLTALLGGVPRTHIIDGRVPHSLLIEMFSDRGIGTMIY